MRFTLPALASLAGLLTFATHATAAGIPEVCCISTPGSASDPCSSSAAKRSLPRVAGCSCFAPDLAGCFVTCCAVGRARVAHFGKTVDYVNTGKRANFFSEDNLGDTVVREGKMNQLVPRATEFLSTIDKWDDDHWKDLIDPAKEYIDTPCRKRARTTIRSGSKADNEQHGEA
ncbi:hypothetical protein B0H13DRAFT_1917665 [Mycena leptocephala]|nr:hypothetical protein B0H13DRAFT_1917665 [Mycena leptocephala]